jgi:Holliday junction resolvase-like predicted endonuclease
VLGRVAPGWVASRVDLGAHELGRLGEELVARDLVRRGWSIRARRVETGVGEIDLLAREPDSGAPDDALGDEPGDALGGALVCVEVKTRRASPLPRRRGATVELRDERSRPARNLGQRQVRRLLRAARAVRAQRVDLVEVWILPRTAPELRHTRGLGRGHQPW